MAYSWVGTASMKYSVTLRNGTTRKATKTSPRTNEPVWNEMFLFPVVNPADGAVLELLAQHGDGVSSVGTVILDFQKMPTDRPLSKSFQIQVGDAQVSVQLRILYSRTPETKTVPCPEDSYAHEQHLSNMKTGGIGTLPALSMMFSDAPISSVGVLARIPNRWTKETELFIVEFTRNTNGFPDALTGETRAGLRVFRFVERLYQFNGSSIFYCPLKTALSEEEEQKFIQVIYEWRERSPEVELENLHSPIMDWVREEFGDEIGGVGGESFMELLSPHFVRDCLRDAGIMSVPHAPAFPMEVVRYGIFGRPVPLRLTGAAGQALQQRVTRTTSSTPPQKAHSPQNSVSSPRALSQGNLVVTPEEIRSPVRRMRSSTSRGGTRSLLTPDFSAAKAERFEKLGSGGFGAVYRCVLEGYTCAVKVLRLSQNTKRMDINAVKTEVAILERAQHPNIVRYLGYDFSKTELILFMEFCPYSLQGILTKKMENPNCIYDNDPREVHKFALEISKGIAFLHNSNPPIIHRDIKTGNVLVAKDSADNVSAVKLCDFGVAKICETNISAANTFVGTPGLMAPEIRMGNHAYSEKVDIWSFGILLYEMITFSSPQLPNIWIPEGLDEEFDPLLKLVFACLVDNPLQRPTAKQIVECLALMYT